MIIGASQPRESDTVTSQDLKTIMLQLAESISMPNAFTNEQIALGADGKPRSVFSPDATQCDLFGWILKLSHRHFKDMRAGRKNVGNVVSIYIDSHIRNVSGDALRLMTLGDYGPAYAARYLQQAVRFLHPIYLPVLFTYAKYFETPEEKKKRLQRAAKRQAA